MKKTILAIIILISLTGCGVFDLNYFVMPDDVEFIACISELDTPEKIGNYMLENFIYELHYFYDPDPYTLWKIKKGDCNDMSTFGVWVVHWHDYEAYQIMIFWNGNFEKHWIAVYTEDDGLSFTDNQYYFNNYGYFFDTFREIVEFDCNYFPDKELRKYIVYDYWNNEVEIGYN